MPSQWYIFVSTLYKKEEYKKEKKKPYTKFEAETN